MGRRMNEDELINSFDEALKDGSIFAVYQPQINHATGRMIGAEALMRWKDPEYGMQYPSDFIPVLEESDLIYKADLRIFELVCLLQKKCLEENITPVPISFNVSRHDIFHKEYVDELEKIRKRIDVPVRFLRVEITESSALGGLELINSVMAKFHSYGYVVEMDDFGSGYSSLNILKDLEVDVIKLDMSFLSGNIGGRGGTIISSVVQMTKWLHTPVIAEGVETMEQADYMKSIGCNYIQGYLYSKPVEEEVFLGMLQELQHEPVKAAMNLVESMESGMFWNPDSIETLIFNNFVGGAAVFLYKEKEEGKVEILRVNDKYLQEMGMNLTAKEFITCNPWNHHEKYSRMTYESAIKKAIETGEEQTCETWRTFHSKCCGESRLCIRSSIRMIGKANDQALIYAMVQNVTNEKKRYETLLQGDNLLRKAFDHANVYAWEYIISTREMHPCFRCMRDLGLPAVVPNYPEPVIESGLFPADYADMYRDMLEQIHNGVDKIEAIIPLTISRVPFHIRYTTEFDENGKPLKAYGSATLVVDGEKDGRKF